MAGFKAPKDKLVCIHNCCKVLSNAILVANKGTGTSASADDMLPMLIYAMAGSKCPKLHSHLAFIGRCRHPERMTGQLAYYYTLAMSAASFISGLVPSGANPLSQAPHLAREHMNGQRNTVVHMLASIWSDKGTRSFSGAFVLGGALCAGCAHGCCFLQACATRTATSRLQGRSQ